MKENILIVVDMQNDFITGSLGTKEAEAIVDNVVKEIESDKYTRVLVTQDTHYDNYLETQEGKNLPVKHCIEGTDGWKFHKKIEEALGYCDGLSLYGDNSLVFKKNTFGSEELVESFIDAIKWGEIEEISSITLVGLCTDICVISNALMIKAFLPEVKIRCIENCCAGVTPEKHNAAIEVMKSCQIEII